MKTLGKAIVTALALGAPAIGYAQDNYPSRTIQIITPFAPGGSTDTSARLFASVLGKYLPNSVNVIVVNVPGGATTIGMMATKNADPDGYTVALTSNSPVTIQPHFDMADYSYDSFEAVIRLVDIPQVLLVQKDAPWQTPEEWLKYVKENPGVFTYSTPGNGSISDLAMATLNEGAKIETRAIPYDSGGRAMAAMLGGNVGGVATFQGNADPDLSRPLINFSKNRSSRHPDVPTLADIGVPAFKDAFIGIVAPLGVPEDRLDILHDAFKQALEDPDVQATLGDLSYETSYQGRDDFAEALRVDYEQNAQLLLRANLID